jgi:2,4-dienoyl-CoA reductase-like NADH-dependent reductase (Old Yellow Enzyme family)
MNATGAKKLFSPAQLEFSPLQHRGAIAPLTRSHCVQSGAEKTPLTSQMTATLAQK